MSAAFDSLPREVQQALAAGQRYEAAQLLRKAKGVSMKSALARIEAVVNQGVPMKQPPPAGPAPSAPGEAAALPDIAALAGRLLALAQQRATRRGEPGPLDNAPLVADPSGLAPGEQPPENLGAKAIGLIVAVALALLLLRDWG